VVTFDNSVKTFRLNALQLPTNPLLVIVCQHCGAIDQWFDFSVGPGHTVQQEWAEPNANDISAYEDG
jgi:hypothetical protein